MKNWMNSFVSMRLLLFGNSTNPGEAYLDYLKHQIKNFLGDKPVAAVFIPYAAVRFSYDEYETKEEGRFLKTGHHVAGLRESTMLWLDGKKLQWIGDRTVRIFKKGIERKELDAFSGLSFLLL